MSLWCARQAEYLHFRPVLPMVGRIVEPKMPPAFRLLFAVCYTTCANRQQVQHPPLLRLPFASCAKNCVSNCGS